MPRIFVIDDDKDLLKVVKSLLLKKGFDVSTYSDWDIANIALRKYQPQLILLDVFLAGIDGLDVCQKLKENAATRHIPILIFSAYPRVAETAIYEYGADDFIAKPFELTDLIEKVHGILSRKNASV
ncbi:MAG: response regulator [Bacteroidota bacterium]|nr:response regulator [Bacteroidota bacterium]